jgi:hypothetical protein
VRDTELVKAVQSLGMNTRTYDEIVYTCSALKFVYLNFMFFFFGVDFVFLNVPLCRTAMHVTQGSHIV